LKSTLQGPKSIVDEPILRIEQFENDVYKLVCLVQNDCLNISLAETIASIKQSVMNPHISNEERRRRLSAWINAIDTKTTYETALQRHHDGTCEWALQLEELQTWASPQPAQGKLLWIHGPPGFGKTFMSAWITQHLIKESQGPVSYFFCVADNQPTRDPYSILRSWLSQLLEQDQAVLPLIEATFATRTSKDQALTHLELWQLFVTVGESISRCTFVVDGFDECTHINSGAQYHTKDPRGDFLRDLVLHLAKTTSRVLVVSRDVPDIRAHLSKGSVNSPRIEVYEYKITAKDTSADVEAFSESMVNQRLPKKTATLREKIAKQAAARSEGMFLWINLLEKEISPGQNAKQLSKTVLEMPSGISEAYSREVEKITQLPPRHKDEALIILRWILFAVRPLQVKELAEALVVSDDDELEEYPQDELPDTWADSFVDEDYVNEMILSRCGSLLQLRSSSPHEPLANHKVHFVHFSVKEYLTSLTRTNPLSGALGLADGALEETRLSKICLRYLALDVFEEIPSNTDIYPFLSYAAWAWYFHGFHRKPTPSKDIMDRTQKVFNPSTSSWRVWSPVLEAELRDTEDEEWDFGTVTSNSYNGETNDSDDEQLAGSGSSMPEETALFQRTVQNPIYYASLLGLVEVVKWLEEQALDCSCIGGRFGFPLQAAVVRNHSEMVSHLLNRNVDVSQKGGQYGAAIIAAAAASTPEIVQILLDAGADVTATDERGWTALHHASRTGAARTIEQLLDRGANINGVTDSGSTATSLACANGNKDVLSVLLTKGADIELADEDGETPLHVAITNGHENLACKLLDAGASVDAQLPDGFTPLLLAVTDDCLEVVNKLLDKNAKVGHIASNDWTALHQAAAIADPKILKALLKAGADVACSDDHGATPLHIAAMNDRPEIVTLLLDHGASVDQTSGGKVGALFMAVQQGSQEAIKLLLERGASVQGIYENEQRTLFDTAIDWRHLGIAEVLVRHGCFRMNSPVNTIQRQQIAATDEPEASLAMMAFSGDTEGVKNLIQERRSSIGQDVLNEALYIAAARGFVDIVTTLLKNGVKVNQKDVNGRTALHHAAFHTHEDVANVLVDNGASLSVEDDIGSTPVDLAVKRGQRALGFIQRYMEDFRFTIKRRPSLLDNTGGQVSATTAADVREAISGCWEGYYDYLSWMEGRKDSFSVMIPDAMPRGSPSCTFSSENNSDEVGGFQFHGFVDEKGIVWFVKLYHRHGWLYRGQLDPDLQIFRGTWGGNRKLWFGTFKLSRSS
jgi:ankyrin repeat protein